MKGKILTASEFNKVIKTAMKTRHALRNKTLICMSFMLALRASEIRFILVKDICDDNCIIRDEFYVYKSNNRKQKRIIYLTNNKMRNILIEYMHDLSQKNALNYHDFLFKSQKDCNFLQQDFIRIFRNIFIKAGLVGATPNSGRRTYIANKIKEGIDRHVIAELLDMQKVKVTNGHDHKNKLKQIAKKNIF